MANNHSDAEFEKTRLGLYQTEPMRLQQEANNYTKWLEQERKNLMILTDNYKTTMEQLQEIKKKTEDKVNEAQAQAMDEDSKEGEEIKAASKTGASAAAAAKDAMKRYQYKKRVDGQFSDNLYPVPKKIKTEDKQKAELKSLKHKLEHEKVLLNNIKGDNKDLRVRITSMRHEIQFAQDSINRMEEAIQKLREDSRTSNTEGFTASRQASETNNQILALKCKHEEGKEAFETDIKKLQEQLKEKDQNVEHNDKSLSRTIEARQGQGSKQEFANPIEILTIRLNSVVNKNLEKKRLLDQYVRNAKIISEAFETIMEATGINNIDEIVTHFIKAEEQNIQLFNYVDQLNQENDQLEESASNYDQQIRHYEELAQMNETDLTNRNNEMSGNNQSLRERIVNNTAEINDQEQEFQEMQLLCQDLALDFKQSGFQTRVATTMDYNEHTNFTEGNITTYLSELEEYLASLIAYTAHKKGDQNASVASVPFNHLNNKDWLARDMAIDPAFDITVQTAEEEEDTVDVNQLYARFQEKIETNQIQGNRKVDVKGQQRDLMD